MSDFTQMWSDIKKSTSVAHGTLASVCGAELQELMKQVDHMIHCKRLAWSRQVNSLKKQLESKQQEIRQLKKDNRMARDLEYDVQRLKQSKEELITCYEKQLTQLRTEVSSMKTMYNKLEKRGEKRARSATREKDKVTSSLKDTRSTLSRISAEMEGFKERCQLAEEAEAQQKDDNRRLMRENLELREALRAEQNTRADPAASGAVQRVLIRNLEQQLNRAAEDLRVKDDVIDSLQKSLQETQKRKDKTQEFDEVPRVTFKSPTATSEETDSRAVQQELNTLQQELDVARTSLQQSEDDKQRLIDTLQQNSYSREALIEKLEQAASELEATQQLQSQLDRCQQQLMEAAKENEILRRTRTEHERQVEELLEQKAKFTASEHSNSLQQLQEETKTLAAELSLRDSQLAARNNQCQTLDERCRQLQARLTDAIEQCRREADMTKISTEQVRELQEENAQLRGAMQSIPRPISPRSAALRPSSPRQPRTWSPAVTASPRIERNWSPTADTSMRSSATNDNIQRLHALELENKRLQSELGQLHEELKAASEEDSPGSCPRTPRSGGAPAWLELSMEQEEFSRNIRSLSQHEPMQPPAELSPRQGFRSVPNSPFQYSTQQNEEVADSLAARFMEDDKERRQLLVDTIDQRIEELRNNTERILQQPQADASVSSEFLDAPEQPPKPPNELSLISEKDEERNTNQNAARTTDDGSVHETSEEAGSGAECDAAPLSDRPMTVDQEDERDKQQQLDLMEQILSEDIPTSDESPRDDLDQSNT